MEPRSDQRVELAFDGGQSLRLRLSPAAVERLRAALAAGERWTSVEEDGEHVDLNLERVVFLRHGGERRPGFAARG
jgi:hypothetical protein